MRRGVEAGGEHAVVRADRDRAVFGLAHQRRRSPQAPVSDRVLEHVEIPLVVDRQLPADPAGGLEGEDAGEAVSLRSDGGRGRRDREEIGGYRI